MTKIIYAIILVLLLGFVIFFFRGNPPSETDRIYTNVYIHGVSVGGMSAEEAHAALAERFQAGLESRVVQYLINGELSVEYTFADFEARLDFSAQIEEALEISRAGSKRVARSFRRGFKIDTQPLFIYNASRLEDIMFRLSRDLDVAPRNAAFSQVNNEITVTEENVGHGVNIEAAARETLSILQSLESGAVELQFISVPPLFTTLDFNFTPTVLGEFQTPVFAGDEARQRNISRAAERINNSVIYPGETFSAGTVIAAHLPESGYETSIVLVRGEPVEDVGGGVCQVVTTLYNAVLRAELEIVQRNNHSARVSYVDLGFDATVAGNYFDLKFRNNTPRPLLVTSHVENDRLFVRIHGFETRQEGRSIRFEVRQVELLQPEPYREVIDPAIPRGQRVVTLESQMGYHVELYKLIYMNGAIVEEVKINSSIYRPLQGIISIGAGQ